jgi:hypothetical protein
MNVLNLKKKDESKTGYTIPFYTSTRKDLDLLSQKTGVSVAKLIIHAVNEMLDNESKENGT